MVSFFRISTIYFSILAFVITTLPSSGSWATTAQQWEDIKDTLELMVPVRKTGETFAETYYRLETRLAPEQKSEMAEINKKFDYKLAKSKAVHAEVNVDTLFLKDGQESLVIKVEKNEAGNLFISINGQALTSEQAKSPLKTYHFIEKIFAQKKDKSVTSWLWHQIVPKSHAFSWPLIIAGTLAAGALGYVVYKKFFKKEDRCSDKGPICCNQNATLVQLTNGCCTESGGLETGLVQCPQSFKDDAPPLAPTPSANPTSGTQ